MKTRVVILAGGEGSRLGVLTAKRTKPAVPFAGKYRIIDFALSNSVNSGLLDVMLLTQYRPHSLIEHIGVGQPWDLDRSFTGGVRVYQPYTARYESGFYKGTADAVQQNFNFVSSGGPDLVLILSGDHIYQMDYEPLITFHVEHGAEMTVATMRVPRAEASRFGVLATDDDYRVTAFVEKPDDPPSNLISMGIYVFNIGALDRALVDDMQNAGSEHDFGKSIIPMLIEQGRNVYAYPYSGYWVDVGTVDSYWQAHMDLLGPSPALDLNDRTWVIHTRSQERPPVLLNAGATVGDSLLTDGTIVTAGAIVERSVLSPGVYVGREAVIRESIILNNARIETGAHVTRTVIDKNTVIGPGAILGRRPAEQADLGITMIGKNTEIPANQRIEDGCTVDPDVTPGDLSSGNITRGSHVRRTVRVLGQ